MVYRVKPSASGEALQVGPLGKQHSGGGSSLMNWM
jgi:hypothetical protein